MEESCMYVSVCSCVCVTMSVCSYAFLCVVVQARTCQECMPYSSVWRFARKLHCECILLCLYVFWYACMFACLHVCVHVCYVFVTISVAVYFSMCQGTYRCMSVRVYVLTFVCICVFFLCRCVCQSVVLSRRRFVFMSCMPRMNVNCMSCMPCIPCMSCMSCHVMSWNVVSCRVVRVVSCRDICMYVCLYVMFAT